MKPLIYYVSGHGLGHAVRTTVMVNAIQRRWPDLPVVIRTGAPEHVFAANPDADYRYMGLKPAERLDVGLVQIDSLRIDFQASLTSLRDLLARSDDLVRREAEFLRGIGPALVACDVPFLAAAAAERAKVPVVAVSNFSWDWIYRSYQDLDPAWAEAADRIASYYSSADLLIQLPMAPDMSATFPDRVEVGLTGRRAKQPADAVRTRLGIPPDRRMALLTFTDLDLSAESMGRMVSQNPETVFVYSAPLHLDHPGFYFADDRRIWYPDLVGAADVVVTKPGYGIVADCLANGTPMVFTDRGRFPEYPFLVEAVESYLHHRYIPSADLYAGRLGIVLSELISPRSNPGWPYSFDGAMEGAEALAKFISN